MLRKAMIQDIKSIHKLLNKYSETGELLARPLSVLYDHTRDFWVFEEKNKITGCCALQFCWEGLAEIRSLAVLKEHTKKGIGTLLVHRIIQEAAAFKIPKLFTLTYRPSFFKRFGFSIIDRAELPIKIWADCIMCVKFPDCDEIAMVKNFNYEL